MSFSELEAGLALNVCQLRDRNFGHKRECRDTRYFQNELALSLQLFQKVMAVE